MSKDYLIKPFEGRSPGITALVTLTCKRCGKPFTIERWIANKGRIYCSNKCKFGTPMDRFLANVAPQPNGCLNWTGYVNPTNGYGQVKVHGRSIGAHQLSYCLYKGPIPDGMNVLHTCVANRLCVNPDHLYAGTQKENARDMIVQGRFRIFAKGEKCTSSILEEKEVLAMRALRAPKTRRRDAEWSYAAIGRMFGVCGGTARQIIEGLTWQDLLPVDNLPNTVQ